VTQGSTSEPSGPMVTPGQVVILNGVPRSGKTSIARALQELAPRPWLHLGGDASIAWLSDRLRPGVGLRPGGERPDLEEAVLLLSRGLYESVAAHARLGFPVVVDAGLHESYARPLPIRADCAERLSGLPLLLVGVHCSEEVIWQRRRATWGQDEETVEQSVRDAVARWPAAVHTVAYDLEVDTSRARPEECAARILARLHEGPPGSAWRALASR
jgi:chloramphenicol 3-O phosphotransferase